MIKRHKCIIHTPYPTAGEVARDLNMSKVRRGRVDRLVRNVLSHATCTHSWHWTSQHWYCPRWPTISDTCRKCNAHRTRKMTADEINKYRFRWSVCRRAECPLTNPHCKAGAVIWRKP
jgi:hypothetical protein